MEPISTTRTVMVAKDKLESIVFIGIAKVVVLGDIVIHVLWLENVE